MYVCMYLFSSKITNKTCVPTPTQRAIAPGSANEYRESWGVNGHTTLCTSPVSVIRGLVVVASAGVRLRAKETEISAARWALEARERTYFIGYLLYF